MTPLHYHPDLRIVTHGPHGMHLAGSLLQNISQVWTDKSNYKQGTFSPLQVVVAKITTGGLLALQV